MLVGFSALLTIRFVTPEIPLGDRFLLALVVTVVVTAAWAVPCWISWNRHRRCSRRPPARKRPASSSCRRCWLGWGPAQVQVPINQLGHVPRHAVALERVYGGDAWRGLYDVQLQDPDFWGNIIEEVSVRKEQAAVVELYREQMLKCFYGVSESSDGWFYSSTGAPLYVLLFACAIQGGSEVAMRIAKHLLSREFLNPTAVQGSLGI